MAHEQDTQDYSVCFANLLWVAQGAKVSGCLSAAKARPTPNLLSLNRSSLVRKLVGHASEDQPFSAKHASNGQGTRTIHRLHQVPGSQYSIV